MEAKELRIGNWVTGFDKYGSYGQILSIWDNQRRTDIQYNRPDIYLIGGYCGGFFADLRPIPLTPEILEQAGFAYMPFLWRKDWINLAKRDDGSFMFNGEACFISYVHQLQNLYFALTGDELEINL